MTQDEAKAAIKLYRDILLKAAKALSGKEISNDGHIVSEHEVVNVFLDPIDTIWATVEYGSPVAIYYLPVPWEAITCQRT